MRCWVQPSPFGDVTVVTTDGGVREISLPSADQPRVERTAPECVVERQLDQWFAGRRHAFDIMLDLARIEGFRRAVLETLVREVPWGETVSYGELAALAGRPAPARAAGSALRHNPIPFVIPCHRVVAAGNRIGGYGGGGEDSLGLKRARCWRAKTSKPFTRSVCPGQGLAGVICPRCAARPRAAAAPPR